MVVVDDSLLLLIWYRRLRVIIFTCAPPPRALLVIERPFPIVKSFVALFAKNKVVVAFLLSFPDDDDDDVLGKKTPPIFLLLLVTNAQQKFLLFFVKDVNDDEGEHGELLLLLLLIVCSFSPSRFPGGKVAFAEEEEKTIDDIPSLTSPRFQKHKREKKNNSTLSLSLFLENSRREKRGFTINTGTTFLRALPLCVYIYPL